MAHEHAEGSADRRIPKGGDFLSKDELKSLTSAKLLERVRALQPMIAAHAEETERLRRPADAVWQALRNSGFFYQFIPKQFGGLEVDFDTFIDLGATIAEACPSTSWTATFCAEHNWVLSHFPMATLQKLWGGDFPYVIAPYTASPPGKAVRTEGGYTISGRWRFGTGVMHADWVLLGAMLDNGAEPPTLMMALVPASEVEVPDTWNTVGMAGTGSNDIVAENVFVPDAHGVPNLNRNGLPVGERSFSNPIYGVPLLPFLGMSAAIPALGAARGMLNLFKARMKTHLRGGVTVMTMTQGEKVSSQLRLAKADILVRSAEVLIRDVGKKLIAVSQMSEAEAVPERIALRAQWTHAVAQIREAAIVMTEGAGSTAMGLANPFQRFLRDILTMGTHTVFDMDVSYELHGRTLVGLPPNVALY